MSSNKSAATNLSSPEQVAETLLDGIKGGRFVPGQRLIEADLTAELGVSRGETRALTASHYRMAFSCFYVSINFINSTL